jgi:DNA-binding NtrC family response regulator
LTQHFCREIAGTLKKNVQGVSQAALMISEEYCWPGNVRELRNVIERAVCLTESNQISIMDLPQQVFDCGKKELFLHSPYLQARKLVLESFERDYLLGLLRLHHGNVARAAQAAGINRTSFHRLLKRHHLHSHEFK